jgi:hypothetical protein
MTSPNSVIVGYNIPSVPTSPRIIGRKPWAYRLADLMDVSIHTMDSASPTRKWVSVLRK